MLVLPLLYVVVFKYLPMCGLIIAFEDYSLFNGANPIDAIFKSRLIGLDNFRRVFSGPEIKQLFINTLLINFYKFIFLFPLPIILAILLNEVRCSAFKRVVQTVVYIPHFISWVIVGTIFLSIFSVSGMVNQLINLLGGESIRFFMEPKLFRTMMVITSGWKETGWSSIIYIAAITTIDPQLYEAAEVDGCRKFRQIWHITIPSILPTIVLMLILRMGNILMSDFSQIFVFYNPTVYSVGDVFSTYIYRVSMGKMDYSFGTAMGLFNSVVSLIFVMGANAMSRKAVGKGLW